MPTANTTIRTQSLRHRCIQYLLATVLMIFTVTGQGQTNQSETPRQGMDLGDLNALSAGEKYRQLNLILMISEGVEAGFLQHLGLADPSESNLPEVRVDDFQTPLNRIADQKALVSNAAKLFRFALANEPEMVATLAELAANNPQEIAQVDLVLLAEDAIIIRTALSGSFEYLLDPGDPVEQGYLESYQQRTVYLRNVMEYWTFEQELAAITDEAMQETGGKMEAYQRFLEDQPELDSFKQHLQAVEHIYWQSRGGKGKPPKLPGDELIESEAKVD
jgi:hypothetical protein